MGCLEQVDILSLYMRRFYILINSDLLLLFLNELFLLLHQKVFFLDYEGALLVRHPIKGEVQHLMAVDRAGRACLQVLGPQIFDEVFITVHKFVADQ